MMDMNYKGTVMHIGAAPAEEQIYCYHVKGELPLEKVNKVQNLIWLCNDCYRMVNNGPIPPNTDEKVLKKIQKYKQK